MQDLFATTCPDFSGKTRRLKGIAHNFMSLCFLGNDLQIFKILIFPFKCFY